jgi:hypothetical protein
MVRDQDVTSKQIEFLNSFKGKQFEAINLYIVAALLGFSISTAKIM